MMDPEQIEARLAGITEELARLEHERWAHWQRYLHAQGRLQPDGSLVLDAALVSRWERQIATPYEDLPLAEQESDREQVRRYLPAVAAALAKAAG